MPRMGRVVLPNYPHHVVQRGHNRQVVFACEDDFQRYLSDMRELKEAFQIKLYAWCLMTNHVHLLVCPESAAGLGQFMKSLAARATREGVQNSVSPTAASQTDVFVQALGEVDGHLRQRQVPVLNGVGPALGCLEYTGIEQLQ
ncbi:Transposase IS200 like [Halopseudomonas salegens]|uniref:Transposase IS200 like n=1 Tax=Halopseudomonas salegens TaxID=1434072 RepID=A0A1H2E0N5_9GAMM|nr:Transposase IS200 like [Halopseudomonas salegens]